MRILKPQASGMYFIMLFKRRMKMKLFRIMVFALILLTASCGSDSREDLINERAATITEMAELGTVEYTVSKIIKANDNKAFYTIGDRKILMSCKAVIKAGIDLKDFNDDNIRYSKESNSITVMLPAPRVLSVNVPAEDVKLEYVKVGFFRSNFNADERNKLLAQGEADIKEDIPNMGILEDARNNARMFVESLFSGLGVEHVYVEFVDKEK